MIMINYFYVIYTQEMPTLQQQLDKIRKIPDRLAGWEETFEIPSNFSHDTNVALATKRLTSAARGEIVRTITAKMISICAYPTAKQVDVVASRLVEEYDVRDRIGLGYVSIIWASVSSHNYFYGPMLYLRRIGIIGTGAYF